MTGSVSRAELTPLGFLRRSAELFPDRVAIVHGERRTTYADFARRVRALASALHERGVEPGDRVAVLAPNTPALLEASFAIPAAGAVLVALNVRLSAGEVATIVGDAGARVVLADHALCELLKDVDADVVRADDTGAEDDPYEQLVAAGTPDEVRLAVDDEDALFALNYTSGTTGKPKGAMYTHRGAYLQGLGDVVEFGLGYDTTYLWVLPMFHCNGWGFPWAVTAVAGRHVCLRRPDPGAIWDALDAERITHYCCAPTVQIGVVGHDGAHELEQPVRVALGGAPPTPALIARSEKLGFRPTHLYGLTETYGPHTVCVWQPEWDELDREEQAHRRARQGQVLMAPDEIRVVADDGSDVPRDGETLGEVVMRGNGVMTGYFGDAERTEEAFRGGWYHSGDIAVWHPDGYIELRDRAKDVIISGGENISTIEVEGVLSDHPAVVEAAVVAAPHERWGERPLAYVVLRREGEADAEELIAFCRERLAHFKCPDDVVFGELPKTSTGKVRKDVLRERAASGD
jgi:fatty-acyl-CoA synthase